MWRCSMGKEKGEIRMSKSKEYQSETVTRMYLYTARILPISVVRDACYVERRVFSMRRVVVTSADGWG